jgi:hypothetical protein
MKASAFSILILSCCILPVQSQSGFDTEAYADYLEVNRDMTYSELAIRHSPGIYYRDIQKHAVSNDYEYFDTIAASFELTADEKAMLEKNQFMVTERLSFGTTIHALDQIYSYDLPVFISTDCILEAIHRSYDLILQKLEEDMMIPNLKVALDLMANGMDKLKNKYGDHPGLYDALCDADIYVTVARSLLDRMNHATTIAPQESVNEILDEVYSEDMVKRPLFSERDRLLDFSQFTPRGHYTNSGDKLEEYFRAMMWLGRIDFFLTPPPVSGGPPWSKEEIRRMHLGAYLLQELLESTGALDVLKENDRLITFMVGEADNLTPWEYSDLIKSISEIENAASLLSDEVYDPYYDAVSTSLLGEQKILSSIFISDPCDPEPMKLPVSYRIFGQRFIIDSYVFSNVVFDRITYQGQKVNRMMPDPLDAMFVLGNNNAGELLKDEIETYHYASQLDALRYLVDAYDEDFWTQSLYNTWLHSLRQLNPSLSGDEPHYFMNTVAWQQQKLNTQLASWAQLRHDNLLYVKQSYTGGIGCSFPHSFVEPYPEFYRQLGRFSDASHAFFSENLEEGSWITSYFQGVGAVMEQLAVIAEKELQLDPLTEEEVVFLKSMLDKRGTYGGDIINGWLSELYFETYGDDFWVPWLETDYVIADVHTQPTDEAGNIIGKVLHVGTGKVNLGVFLVDHPSDNDVPTAYIGPFQSYYEHFTIDFDRKTDEWWSEKIDTEFPERPDWTNVYLIDNEGNTQSKGRELKGGIFTSARMVESDRTETESLIVYPNPVINDLSIKFRLQDYAAVNIELFDASGRLIRCLLSQHMPSGEYIISRSLNAHTPGMYYLILSTEQKKEYLKIIKQ